MAALANSSDELERGKTLDRYELVLPVARGGMARVWVAKLRGKHGFEKMVALKTILPIFAEDPRFRRMFLDEAKIASGIEHVNVAQILDLGEQDGQLYLVMEWVDGDSLQELDRAAEKAGLELPIPVLVRVLADACAGLHAAHELSDAHGRALNVVHRDVSPQNILISSKGVVKVIDFGVVKARRRATEETTTGTIKGKLQYMAPEQALGQSVDRRADIFSVGATLYRLLARRPVYRGSSPFSTFQRLTSAAPPEPLPAHVPGALSSIVLRALSFDPAKRYATAAELGAELEGLLQGPYQTTSREVSAVVEQYLGAALVARRNAILEALEESSLEDRTHPQPPEWSGVSEAKTLPHALSTVPPSESGERELKSLSEDVTRPLNAAPRPPRRQVAVGVKLALAGVVVALGGALGSWLVPSSEVVPALPSSSSSPLIEAAPAPLVPPPAAEPEPPAPPADEPLSVQALPMLEEPPKAAARPAPTAAKQAPKYKPVARPVAPSKPKRKVVDDGF